MKIGFAITTTPKRFNPERDYFEMCPKDSVCHLHNDVKGIGMATAKNRGIKFLYDAGCDYMILMDDDTRILNKYFAEFLVRAHLDSGIHHFIYPFKNSKVVKTERMNGSFIQHWNHGAGVLLFITREVVEKVGYLNMNYPAKWGHIHIGYSRRILRSGLMPGCTDWRVSVAGIKDYFWSADIDGIPEVQNYTAAEQKKQGQMNMPSLIAEDKGPIYQPFNEVV